MVQLTVRRICKRSVITSTHSSMSEQGFRRNLLYKYNENIVMWCRSAKYGVGFNEL